MMKRIYTFIYVAKKEEINDAIIDLAKKLASYDGDPIDDWQEYRNIRVKDRKIIKIMTPVGEYLFFHVEPANLEKKTYFVEFLASSWNSLDVLYNILKNYKKS